jgi:hypothetical protein
MVTISNYKVTPIVAKIAWPIDLFPQPSEVEKIFTIPLSWLAKGDNHRTESRSLPESSENHPVIYFKEYDGQLLWGVTAHIVLNFLEAIGF